jgi:hypothetical protein
VLPVLGVPLLTPRLSSAWLALVTDVDLKTARNLVDSMTNEVVVHDHSIDDVVPLRPMGFDDAVATALAERSRERDERDERERATQPARADRRDQPDPA